MTKLSFGLWLVLAFVVFTVRFDWQTKVVAQQFAAEQLARYQQGQPVVSINDGFRPRVHAEAKQARAWSGLILAVGTAATAFASRR